MSSFFHKHQQSIMIAVTIVVIASVAIYWSGPGSRDRMSTGVTYVGKIYGNSVPVPVFQREARKAEVAGYLGMYDLLAGLAGKDSAGMFIQGMQYNTGISREEALYNFAWNSMVLAHEADALQTSPADSEADSSEEVKNAIMALPRFQTVDGQFDSGAYNDFVSNRLASYGFTDSDLNQLVAEEVRMKKIEAYLKTTFIVSPAEFLAQYTLEYQTTHASVVHFNLQDIAAGIKVSDDDIKNTFEQHLEGYKSPEKRGLKYASFVLTDDQKKLEGKDRIDVMQKLSNDAQAFTQDMLEKGANFDAVAAKYKVPVTNVPPFAPDAPDPKLIPTRGLLVAAFTATPKEPNSDVVGGEDGFYVAQLQDIVPSRQLTLSEARPQIIKEVQQKRAIESISTTAGEVRNRIMAAMHEGKSFEDAVKAAGQKAEAYPPFSFSEPDIDKPDARQVLFASQQMKEGDISPLIPTEDGGILVHIDKRDPIDQAKFEKDKVLLMPRFADDELYFVFREWLRTRRIAADIQEPNTTKSEQPRQQQQAPPQQQQPQAPPPGAQ